MASRFIKPGEPTVKLEGPTLVPKKQRHDYARQMRELQAKAPRPRAAFLPTIESTDRALANALLQLAVHESAENHRLVAAAYRNAGIDDYAHRHLQKAVRIAPCDADAYNGLARIERDWGDLESALGSAHRGLYCRPASAELYNTLGTVLQALGQPEAASDAFLRAVQLDSHAAFALNNLCYLAVEDGDGRRAEGFCLDALSADPTLASARTNLALAVAQQGDIAGAERRLRESSDAATALFNIGVLRMSIGNYAAAAEAFDAAAAAQPWLKAATRRASQARALAATQEQKHADR
jgi:Flp pilus assembly protein TadD